MIVSLLAATLKKRDSPCQTSSQTCRCVTCRKLSGGAFQAFPDVVSKEVTFFDNKERLCYEGLPKDNIGGMTFLRLLKGGEQAFCVSSHTLLTMRYHHDYITISLTFRTVDK